MSTSTDRPDTKATFHLDSNRTSLDSGTPYIQDGQQQSRGEDKAGSTPL